MSKLAPSLTKMTDSVANLAHEIDKAFKQVPPEVVALETQAVGSEVAVLVKGFSGVEAAALEAYSKRLESVEERLDAMQSAILMREIQAARLPHAEVIPAPFGKGLPIDSPEDAAAVEAGRIKVGKNGRRKASQTPKGAEGVVEPGKLASGRRK